MPYTSFRILKMSEIEKIEMLRTQIDELTMDNTILNVTMIDRMAEIVMIRKEFELYKMKNPKSDGIFDHALESSV